jgi:16S rRNA (guanine1207-N2)-methyltransferase
MADSSHYFDESPSVSSQPHAVDLVLPDLTLRLATDRGVFAGRHVDAGTRVLLLEAPPPDDAPGDLLDLGCGYGPVALTLAARAPQATVWAVDVNARARELCAANAAANGLENVRVAAPDEVPDGVEFAGIWSNPPVRVGKDRLHQLLMQWLAKLADGGAAWLVVHRQLGSDSLARWLAGEGFTVRRLVSRQGYRVLEVRRARA